MAARIASLRLLWPVAARTRIAPEFKPISAPGGPPRILHQLGASVDSRRGPPVPSRRMISGAFAPLALIATLKLGLIAAVLGVRRARGSRTEPAGD